jgi:hypothetical protein
MPLQVYPCCTGHLFLMIVACSLDECGNAFLRVHSLLSLFVSFVLFCFACVDHQVTCVLISLNVIWHSAIMCLLTCAYCAFFCQIICSQNSIEKTGDWGLPYINWCISKKCSRVSCLTPDLMIILKEHSISN